MTCLVSAGVMVTVPRNPQPHITWLLKFVESDAMLEAAARTGLAGRLICRSVQGTASRCRCRPRRCGCARQRRAGG